MSQDVARRGEFLVADFQTLGDQFMALPETGANGDVITVGACWPLPVLSI
jgi:hypothetical protein